MRPRAKTAWERHGNKKGNDVQYDYSTSVIRSTVIIR
jgi:hypothetical protein